jgi:uncharacterized protein YueI
MNQDSGRQYVGRYRKRKRHKINKKQGKTRSTNEKANKEETETHIRHLAMNVKVLSIKY